MTCPNPAAELQAALASIRLAQNVMELNRGTFERFLEERERLDSVAPIVDPTFWMKTQRESSWREPIHDAVRAAVAFLDTCDRVEKALLAEQEAREGEARTGTDGEVRSAAGHG